MPVLGLDMMAELPDRRVSIGAKTGEPQDGRVLADRQTVLQQLERAGVSELQSLNANTNWPLFCQRLHPHVDRLREVLLQFLSLQVRDAFCRKRPPPAAKASSPGMADSALPRSPHSNSACRRRRAARSGAAAPVPMLPASCAASPATAHRGSPDRRTGSCMSQVTAGTGLRSSWAVPHRDRFQ